MSKHYNKVYVASKAVYGGYRHPAICALRDRMALPNRHYHTIEHLNTMLAHLRSPWNESTSLLLAVLWHDAVQTSDSDRLKIASLLGMTGSHSDEQLSAALMLYYGGANSEDLKIAAHLITHNLAGNHVIETFIQSFNSTQPLDRKCTSLLTYLLWEADIAILSAPLSKYLQYRKQIRAEYRMLVPSAVKFWAYRGWLMFRWFWLPMALFYLTWGVSAPLTVPAKDYYLTHLRTIRNLTIELLLTPVGMLRDR